MTWKMPHFLPPDGKKNGSRLKFVFALRKRIIYKWNIIQFFFVFSFLWNDDDKEEASKINLILFSFVLLGGMGGKFSSSKLSWRFLCAVTLWFVFHGIKVVFRTSLKRRLWLRRLYFQISLNCWRILKLLEFHWLLGNWILRRIICIISKLLRKRLRIFLRNQNHQNIILINQKLLKAL